jgi:hypothetical protein
MLERYAMKVARTVLRGGSGSNVTPLPDHLTSGILRDLQAFFWLRAFPALKHYPRPPTRRYLSIQVVPTSRT